MSAIKDRRTPRTQKVDRWGVCNGYEDATGCWHAAKPRTLDAIRSAMGGDGLLAGTDEVPVRVVHQGEPHRLSGASNLLLEDGGSLHVRDELPQWLPLGYHQLRGQDGRPDGDLVVCPRRCFLPEYLPTWGWSVQLYALRSASSWGIGDLGDLRRLARWSARELGAGVLQVSPLCAATPVLPQQSSPYSPSSRCFRNPLYLCIEEVAEAYAPGLDLRPLADEGRKLNAERRIDRDAVFRLKMAALRRIYEQFSGDPSYGAFCARHGRLLERFAVFCVLAEVHGPDWRTWPESLRDPDSPVVERFGAEHAGRTGFHQWVQWLLEEQFRQAAVEINLVQDLPIGTHPAGADAWMWQHVMAREVHVGAPPDPFNAAGQDWGLAPFVAHRLQAARYRPFVDTIRASLRHAGGLRVDHVIGLFRQFWIPPEAPPQAGAYVRYPSADLLALLALESVRNRSLIIGEDLGTVEPAVRDELAARSMLSYRVLWFEPVAPAKYPEMALAAVTTHDLPTVAGLWSGSDLEAQLRIGLPADRKGFQGIRRRLRRMAGLRDGAKIETVIRQTYKLLADSPSVVLLGTLDDALGVHERPNMPGTTTEWPNWSLALPSTLEEIEQDKTVRAVATSLRRG
jgi:4-alpha-glucanotransferase